MAVEDRLRRVVPRAAERHLAARRGVGVHVVQHHFVGLVAQRTELNDCRPRLPRRLREPVELIDVAHVLVHAVQQRARRYPRRQGRVRAEPVSAAGIDHHARQRPGRLCRRHLRQAGFVRRGNRLLAAAGLAFTAAFLAFLAPGRFAHRALGQNRAVEAHCRELIVGVADAADIIGRAGGFRLPVQAVGRRPDRAVLAGGLEHAGAVGRAVQIGAVGGETPRDGVRRPQDARVAHGHVVPVAVGRVGDPYRRAGGPLGPVQAVGRSQDQAAGAHDHELRRAHGRRVGVARVHEFLAVTHALQRQGRA